MCGKAEHAKATGIAWHLRVLPNLASERLRPTNRDLSIVDGLRDGALMMAPLDVGPGFKSASTSAHWQPTVAHTGGYLFLNLEVRDRRRIPPLAGTLNRLAEATPDVKTRLGAPKG